MIKGTIIKGIGGFYYVKTKDGRVAECRARGKLRKNGVTPIVGDIADISIVNESPFEGAVEGIEPRKNFLLRPSVSNIDCVAVVIASQSPSPDLFLVDKLIVCAENAGIKVIIVINKTDLSDGNEIGEIYSRCGYEVFYVSAKNNSGIDSLKQRICGSVTAFAGNSGVGKSSILEFFGFDLETGEVSRIERGKHTTRHVELYEFGGGYVIDTPGFSLLEVGSIKCDKLKQLFPEFEKYNDLCRFKGCMHYGASAKDCAVTAAVFKGEIPKSRFESYTQLYSILKEIKDYD